MNEAKAREIFGAEDLEKYSHTDLREADQWVKSFALQKLGASLADQPKAIRKYMLLMARCHYGSVETDAFLKEMDCYPAWVRS
jgi:hypothetical protein